MRLSYCDHHIISFLRIFADSTNRPLDLCLSQYLREHKSIGAHDRRTIGETLFGMFRWKSLIDYFCKSDDPKERLFCYRKMAEWQGDPKIPEAARLGINEFLYGRFRTLFGKEKTHALCTVLNGTAPTTLRTNLAKISREDLLVRLQAKFPCFPCEFAPAAIQLKKREPLFALDEFKEGLFEVQDEGSQLVAELMQVKPGEKVLDYCSGSGGKTLAFAHLMDGKGQIYLHDIREWVLLEARKRLKRAGIQNAQGLAPGHPQLKAIKGKMDWVLVDAPCSGTGTLRRNPDSKWKIDAAMVEWLIQEQREIVKQALEYVKPGGFLVYATCSLLPEENQEQTDYFLKNHPLALEKEPLSLLPKENGMDGFYSALFRKI